MDAIRIAGAGVAGLTAAIVLARAGRRVVVYDRLERVGSRHHGDLQGLRNWIHPGDNLAWLRSRGIAPDFPLHPSRRIWLTDGHTTTTFTYREPVHRLLRRGPYEGTLDRALERQARALGVELRLGEPAPARVHIRATGPEPRRIFAVARGITFQTDREVRIWGLVHPEAAPGGYAYLLSWNGWGCIVTVSFRDFQRTRRAFDATLRIFDELVELPIHEPRPMGGVGAFSPEGPYRDGDSLLVGEAAGLQDAAFGFGVDLAVESGWLAARSLLLGFDYERAARRRFRPLLRATVVARAFWDRFFLGRGFRPLLAAGKLFERVAGDTRPLIALSHRHGPPQRLLYPWALRRWERSLGRGG